MTTALSSHFPIAIVGIGCRFPQADGPLRLWELLENGRDAVGEMPRDRFDVDRLYDPAPSTPGRMNTKWGGFLENIDLFDIDFFDMSPREAERLDPQQRLLLETCWEALEDAGVVPDQIVGSQAGVFVGMWINEYEARLFRDLSGVDFYMTTGSGRYAASGRLSYVLGIQGPSITVDTGCSSSLVAVHLACQSLWTGETSLGLAAGVNLILEPHVTVAYSQSRMMAPDGRCKFGDARANGYVRSEGAGVIVLKRLDAALAAGDRIYATILGTSVTNDGRSGGFLTTPGAQGQVEMLRLAYQRAGIAPAAVTYVEAHGTGTRAGDPVEIGALAEILGEGRSPDQPCRIGSVKTNIGHTEGAAGIAGLIKVALSLKHRAWPASLHCEQKNPEIPWSDIPVVLQQVHQPWLSNGVPVIAGVNSFGISGTNAHAVLREHADSNSVDVEPVSSRPCVLTLSGHTEAALHARVAQFRDWLQEEGSCVALGDTCWTAAVRRTHHNYRAALAARDVPHLIEQLDGLVRGELGSGVVRGRRHAERSNKAVFIFPGQGSQWYGMARQLLRDEPVFRVQLEECDRAVRALVGWSVIEELGEDESRAHLSQINYIQPVLFSVQVALAKLWRSWGVEPAAVVGHSMGEVAAGYVAGALSIEGAARVICRRSRLLRRTSGLGAMAVVDLGFDEAQAAIGDRQDRVSVAASNSPRTTVLSGDPHALDELLQELEGQEVFCRRVKVDVASHSPQMDPLRADLLAELEGLSPTAGSVPVYSTVTGRVTDGSDFDSEYWVRNLRQPVRFSSAVQALVAAGHDTFIEISPHPILVPAVEEGVRAAAHETGIVMPSLRRDQDEALVMLGSLGALHAAGYPVEWQRLHGSPGRHVDLPQYPWQRERFWMDAPSALDLHASGRSAQRDTSVPHPILGPPREMSDRPGTWVWDVELSERSGRYLTGHHLDQKSVVPLSTALDLALAAAFDVYGEIPCTLEDIEARHSLFVPAAETPVSVQLVLRETASRVCSFRLSSRQGAVWTLHVCGRIDLTAMTDEPTQNIWMATGSAADQHAEGEDAERFYQRIHEMGLDVAPALRTVTRTFALNEERVAEIELPLTSEGELGRYAVHPAAVDPIFQLVAVSRGHEHESFANPVRIARINFRTRCARVMRAGVRPITFGSSENPGAAVDAILWDQDGRPSVEMLGVEFQQQSQGAGCDSGHLENWLYELQWEPVTPAATSGSVRTHSRSDRWLILADQSGVGESLAGTLAEHGAGVVLVTAGSKYEKKHGARYTATPGERRDLEAVLEDAFPGQTDCAGVLHMWSLDVDTQDCTSPASLDRSEALSAKSAVDLVQTISARDWNNAPRVWFLTCGAQAVGGEARIAVPQAPVWGIGRAVREEHPELWGGLIDLDPYQGAAAGGRVTEWLLSSGGEDQLAFRESNVYALRLARLALEPGQRRSFHLRRDGTYLIAGGLGDLGLQVARWLAEQGATRLVLLARTPLPARSEWRQIQRESRDRRRIAAVRSLEGQGVSLRIESIDVADDAALRALLAGLESEEWPPLRGVVQCAGVLEGRLIQHLDSRSVSEGLRGKVAGSWNLHAATLSAPLDFFVLFSSIASYLVSPGQAAYAAANAFQDALAADRHAQGLPALSINWGPWSLGMAVAPGERGAGLASRGVESLASVHGLAAMSLLMPSTRSQASVMRFSWPRWNARPSEGSGPTSFFSLLAREPETNVPSSTEANDHVDLRRQLAAASKQDRLARIEVLLREQVAQVLKRSADRVDLEKPLRTMGLDSLMALELRNRLEAALGLRLPATLAWNYPTVRLLAAQLSSRLARETAPSPSIDTAPQIKDTTEHLIDGAGDDIERLLSEIEQLSDEEARRLNANG